jgi:mRNA interferase MazF
MTDQNIRRGEVWWVRLDPTQGSEIQKTRPCVVLTHDTLNKLRRTVVVIPLSGSARAHPPVTIPVTCEGNPAVAVIDQIRAVAKHRLRSKIDDMASNHLNAIAVALGTILELKS